MTMRVTFHGNKAILGGQQLEVGDSAPAVLLLDKSLKDVCVGGAQDFVQIISVVPSLDTGICAKEAREFNKRAAKIEGAKVIVVSVDTPFAQGRFCEVEGISNLVVLSDFRDKAFGKKYGLEVKTTALAGVLARAVIVVNKEGKVIYQEICKEIGEEPDYDAALKSINESGASCGCGCH